MGEVLSSARPGADQIRGTAESWERRALLVHLGDVLEAIACISQCAEHHNTVGEAAAQEESLAGFPMLRQVDAGMTPAEFVKRAARAFFMWPTLVLEGKLNRRGYASGLAHRLFGQWSGPGRLYARPACCRCHGSAPASRSSWPSHPASRRTVSSPHYQSQ
jgi:hypothetical protein